MEAKLKSKLATQFLAKCKRDELEEALSTLAACKLQTVRQLEDKCAVNVRVRQSAPFSKVGIDFAGPLFVKSKTGEMVKSYFALFTCCVTRAVHLDLVADLTATTFLRCLRRFTARRGTPSLIISDNAKTFKASAKVIKRLYDNEEVRAHLWRDFLPEISQGKFV